MRIEVPGQYKKLNNIYGKINFLVIELVEF